MTYEDVAEHLGVAEVTVKRIFSARPVYSHYLFPICSMLNISYLGLVKKALEVQKPKHSVSESQAEFFLHEPKYLGFVQRHRDGETFTKLCHHYGLNEGESHRLARTLEDLELVSFDQNGTVRSRIQGIIELPKTSPLAKNLGNYLDSRLLRQIRDLPEADTRIVQSWQGRLSERTLKIFQKKLEYLNQEMRNQARTEEQYGDLQDLTQVRWVMGIGEINFDWRHLTAKNLEPPQEEDR